MLSLDTRATLESNSLSKHNFRYIWFMFDVVRKGKAHPQRGQHVVRLLLKAYVADVNIYIYIYIYISSSMWHII